MILRTLLLCFSAVMATAQLPLEEYSANHVIHGPMLGLVTESSAKVWARTHRAGAFTAHYGLKAEHLDQISAVVSTSADHDHTGFLTLTGLKPQTEYHYQIFIGKVPSGPGGRFLTLPSAEAHYEATHNPKGLYNFRFQFGSCSNQNPKTVAGPVCPLTQPCCGS
jgi:phosphodiesterase/alkaline phosphatase D-like protein